MCNNAADEVQGLEDPRWVMSNKGQLLLFSKSLSHSLSRQLEEDSDDEDKE